MIGASASSLRTASAHEVGQQQVTEIHPQPKGQRQQRDDDGLDEERDHVTQAAADEQRDPAHRGDSGPLDHPGPQLGDETEP
jgi:hypothetical protein